MHKVYFSSILRPSFWRSSLSLYSYLKCIPTLHLYSHWSSFGYLSYQGFVGSGKMCYKLWGYCSEVILPLMWLAELVQCIEYRGDRYFTWIFPFFFTCTSLSPSLVFCLLVQVACLKAFRELFILQAPWMVGVGGKILSQL